MKKLLISFILILSYFLSVGQVDSFPIVQGLGSAKTLINSPGAIRSHFIDFIFVDTAAANSFPNIKWYNGANIKTSSGGLKTWGRYNGAWVLQSGGGSGNFWSTSGNNSTSGFVLGTQDSNRLAFETNNQKRLAIPSNGIIRATGSGNKYLMIDTTAGTGNGNLYYGDAGSAGLTWNLTGNSGTTAGTNFVGTTDNVDLVFKTNAALSGRIGVSGTTAFGYETGLNTTSNSITAVGYQALKIDVSLGNNTGVGYQALTANTTAYAGTAVGAYSLWANTTGTGNTAIGARSLFLNTTGTTNTAAGGSALENNSTGSYNAAVGGNALHNNTTGSRNVAMGNVAGQTNETGNRNTIVGSDADVATVSTSDGVALGYRAVAVSKQLALSDSINQIKATGIPSGSGYVLTDVGGTGIFTAAPAGTAYFQNSLTGDTAFTNPSTDHFLFKSDVWGYGLLSANNSDTTKGAKVDTATLFPAIRATISSGGSQTPWLSNINGANYGLDSVGWLRVGVSGGIITENEAFYSEQPQNASYYGSVDVTITGNQALDVEGNLTLAELNITNAGSNFVRNTNSPDLLVTAGDTYVFSMDIKQGTLSSGYYSVYDVTHSANIIAPTLFSIPAGLATRFTSASFVIPAGCTEIYIYPARDVPSTGTYFVGRFQVAHVGNAYIQTTTAQAPPSGSGGYLTAISTDSVNANIGLHGAPDATFNTTEYGSLQLLGDSLYSPNLPLLPLDSANYKLEVIKTSDGKHVRMNWPTAAATVPLSGITRGTATNIVSNAGNVFGIDSTSALVFYGGNSLSSTFSQLRTATNDAQLVSQLASNVSAFNFTYNNGNTSFANKKLLAGFRISTAASFYNFLDSNHLKIKADTVSILGNTGFGTLVPSAVLQIKAGTATAGTAPIKFTSGTVMTTPEAGALEYNSGLLMLDSSNSQRDTIATRKWARNNISGGGTSSQWTTLSSDIYYNTGNVGIGSASAPTDKLHIRGASSSGETIEGSQPMLTLNATSNDPQITLTRAGNSSNMYVNSSTQLIVQGYNEVKVQQSGTTGFGIFSYVGGSFNSAFSIGSISNPTSTLQSYGTFSAPTVTKTGTYTATDYDYTILCSTNTFTINLPALSGITGRIYVIKNITTATTITVDGNASETIDGSTTYSLAAQYKFVMIQAGVSEWNVIGSN